MKLAWRPCRLGESITLEGSELGSHVGAALIGTLLMLALLLKVLSRGIYDHGFTLLCIILTLLNRRGGPQLPDTPMTPSPKWVLTLIIILFNNIFDPPCTANQCPRPSGMTLLCSLEQIISWTYRVKPPSPQSDSEQYVVWSILCIIY